MKRPTTISIDPKILKVGRALAASESRSFSGQVEALIIAEAQRRGKLTPQARVQPTPCGR